MRLIVENPNGIVTSAFIRQLPLSFNVYINTSQRGVAPVWEVSNSQSDYSEEGFPDHGWEFEAETEIEGQASYDSVIVVAESEEDKAILRRFKFELHDKNQIWYMLPADEIHTGAAKPEEVV